MVNLVLPTAMELKAFVKCVRLSLQKKFMSLNCDSLCLPFSDDGDQHLSIFYPAMSLLKLYYDLLSYLSWLFQVSSLRSSLLRP